MARVKAPKSIAGMRIPKRLRKSRIVSGLLNHPLGRTILAEALVAAAGAAAVALQRQRQDPARSPGPGGEQRDGDGRPVTPASDTIRTAAGTLGVVVSEFLRSALPDERGNDGKRRKSGKKKRRRLQARAKEESRRAAGAEAISRH